MEDERAIDEIRRSFEAAGHQLKLFQLEGRRGLWHAVWVSNGHQPGDPAAAPARIGLTKLDAAREAARNFFGGAPGRA